MFQKPRYKILAIIVFIALFILNVYIWASGDFSDIFNFIWDVFWANPVNVTLTFIVMGLAAISIPMSLYAYKRAKEDKGKGLIGTLASIITTASLSITCVACISPLVALVGATGSVFLINYSWVISLIGIALMLISIKWATEKILGICKTC